jgi:uncharacterized protein YjhX (UPF0386 family)
MQKKHARPMRVDFFQNDRDFTVALMGELGFSTAFIMAKTGLTFCQISYRLGRAEAKRSNYRNGDSPIARSILQTAKSHETTGVNLHVIRKLERQKLWMSKEPMAKVATRRGVRTISSAAA